MANSVVCHVPVGRFQIMRHSGRHWIEYANKMIAVNGSFPLTFWLCTAASKTVFDRKIRLTSLSFRAHGLTEFKGVFSGHSVHGEFDLQTGEGWFEFD